MKLNTFQHFNDISLLFIRNLSEEFNEIVFNKKFQLPYQLHTNECKNLTKHLSVMQGFPTDCFSNDQQVINLQPLKFRLCYLPFLPLSVLTAYHYAVSRDAALIARLVWGMVARVSSLLDEKSVDRDQQSILCHHSVALVLMYMQDSGRNQILTVYGLVSDWFLASGN